jgi:hypothetical protein
MAKHLHSYGFNLDDVVAISTWLVESGIRKRQRENGTRKAEKAQQASSDLSRGFPRPDSFRGYRISDSINQVNHVGSVSPPPQLFAVSPRRFHSLSEAPSHGIGLLGGIGNA